MGGALLNGWLSNGENPKNVTVFEPNPSEWLMSLTKFGLNLNTKLLKTPDVCIIAVKPQMIEELLSQDNFSGKISRLFVSIAAGTKIQTLNQLLKKETAIVRVMPNTPATIGKGVSCILPNEHASDDQIKLVESLFSVVGQTIRLSHEKEMDAVTAISGSGPAYVFYLIEALTNAGVEAGLKAELAYQLATLTVSGSGMLAEESEIKAHQLRANVTSPNGTTEAALKVLMDPKTGLLPLMSKTVLAASERSKDLGS